MYILDSSKKFLGPAVSEPTAQAAIDAALVGKTIASVKLGTDPDLKYPLVTLVMTDGTEVPFSAADLQDAALLDLGGPVGIAFAAF